MTNEDSSEIENSIPTSVALASPQNTTPIGVAAVSSTIRSPTIAAARHEIFLSELALDGNVSRAAAAAGCDRSSVYQYARAHPEFKERWDTAVETAIDAIQAEAFRRAVEGVAEPVFYKGVECGRVTRYSDSLLLALLKRFRPAFRDGGRFEITNAPGQGLQVDESPIIVARKVAIALAQGLRAAEAAGSSGEDIV